MKIIEIIIAPDGQTRVETKGFTGSDCQEASRLLESALGRRQSETLTADYYRANARQNEHTHEET